MADDQLKTGEKQDRNEKGQFIEGASANPDGRPKGSRNKFSMARLEEAMEAEEKLAGVESQPSVFQQFVRMAYINPGVMIALMRKFVPDKQQTEVTGVEGITFTIKQADDNKQ